MIFKLYIKFIGIAVIFLLTACTGYSQKQDFMYMPVPAQYLKSKLPAGILQQAQTAKKQAYDATAILPRGYVKDGSVDYTHYLQAALNDHSIVLMPNFGVMVNDTGLTIKSGQTVVFNDSSKLIVKPSALDTYEILRVHQANNVVIYFPNIIGDKDTHLNTVGQWGMGIAIRASKNVTIVKPTISKCWGDAIYIGQIKKQPAENINIMEPYLDNNRRNGLSVTCVNGLNITGGVISNSNGQTPMSGIDVEPNHTTDIIDNITINNLVTLNHPYYGIVLSLQHLVGRQQGSTSIKILNTIDVASKNGIGIIGKPNPTKLEGNIQIINPLGINEKETAIKLPLRTYGIKLFISNPKIRSASGQNEMEKLKKHIRSQADIQLQ